MGSLKNIFKLLLPPFFIIIGKKIKNRLFKKEWIYIPEGWDYLKKHPEIKGWNHNTILNAYKKKWPTYIEKLNTHSPLAYTHECTQFNIPNICCHNINMTYGYILGLASQNKKTITILDFGGGIGHYYALSQAIYPELEIHYNCHDLKPFTEEGKKIFPNQLFTTEDDVFTQTYDLVIAGTSLHYINDWTNIFKKLTQATANYLYIAQLPVITNKKSFVYMQHPFSYGYDTKYLSWCLNKSEFLHHATKNGLTLIREFYYGYFPPIANAPEKSEYQGFLFKK